MRVIMLMKRSSNGKNIDRPAKRELFISQRKMELQRAH